ncbi:phosphatase PAP2 family protein [Thiosocius teredinicola]|uniref:hypothetical protein n=1 Tax=Thiosocius teredinicola TaxID=1973002 RepID=UPI000990C380
MNNEQWFRIPDWPTLRTVLLWCLVIDLLFFPIYGGVNWLTSQRNDLLALYLPIELDIPLVPAAVWVYLSLFLLFCLPLFTIPRERARSEALAAILGLLVAAVLWLLFPAQLGFERMLPAGYETLYGVMFTLDAPHNLVPSLHIVFATIAVSACGEGAPRAIKTALWAWLACIAASTLLTHQHHVLDVATGLLIALGCRGIALGRSPQSYLQPVPHLVKEQKG